MLKYRFLKRCDARAVRCPGGLRALQGCWTTFIWALLVLAGLASVDQIECQQYLRMAGEAQITTLPHAALLQQQTFVPAFTALWIDARL